MRTYAWPCSLLNKTLLFFVFLLSFSSIFSFGEERTRAKIRITAQRDYTLYVNGAQVGSDADFYSKEICTGPHVDNTSQLSQFKILKEESAGSGKRRLYATLK